MRFLGVGLLALPLLLTGCASRYIQVDLHNASGSEITLVEVDYPSASFGDDVLANGATFNYRFKIIGSGPTKVVWTDTARQVHTVAGPMLHEGNEGRLSITITPTGATFTPALVH